MKFMLFFCALKERPAFLEGKIPYFYLVISISLSKWYNRRNEKIFKEMMQGAGFPAAEKD